MGPRPEQYKKISLTSDERNNLILEEIQLREWLENLSDNQKEVWNAYLNLSPEYETIDTDWEFYSSILSKNNMNLFPENNYKKFLEIYHKLHLL